MNDKTVLVTGASSGIGHATVAGFLDADWTVYATARDPDDISDLADAGAKTQRLDVTEDSDVEEAIDRVIDEDGRIDCLVNNAGYGQFGPLEDVPVEALHDQFDVNVYGPHRLTRAVLPHMREQADGTIINISSVAGRISTPGMGTYTSSKFALEAMSDALRSEVDPYDIDVVLVEPGPVATNFDDRATAELDDRLERSGAYETLYRFYEDQEAVGGASSLAIDPERVTDVILEAACSPNPDPRYPVGQVAKMTLLARFLPDRLRDGVFRLVRKLV